jgi:aryl-alcohol dehydrogenase-like predicted oxidoreductase
MRPLWKGGPVGHPLGVGAWAWGDRGYWGYGTTYTSEDVARAYRASRQAGLTLFDTAELYGSGHSERLLGQLVSDNDDRGRVQIATKFAPWIYRVGRRGVLLGALQESLTRLQLERVELYQIHWAWPLVRDQAWLADLAEAVRRGLVDAVGVSNYGPRQLRAAHRMLADLGVPLATNQVQYSLVHRKPEKSGLAELCRELEVTIIAYSPLAQGLLTGKYVPGRPPPGVRGLRYRRILPRIEPIIAQLMEIGRGHGGRTPAQVALNWLISKGTVPIPGAKNAAQAEHNAGGVGWELTAAEVAALDQIRL